MNTLGILQARVSSSRLPGKVLAPILGVPMLFRQIERLLRCKHIDKLLVATSTDSSDDRLVSECQSRGIPVLRGSLDDVLDRFFQAALEFKPRTVVRMTGDCPLADPNVIDETIKYFYSGDFDYVSNCNPPTFPDGLDVEVFKFECLSDAHEKALLPSEREHVTPYIRKQSNHWRLGNLTSRNDLSHMRWTVDEPEDFKFVKAVYERLYENNKNFDMNHVLELLERNPQLQMINSKFMRNEGLVESLKKDREFLIRN